MQNSPHKSVPAGFFLHAFFLAVLVIIRAWLSHSAGFLFYPDSETYELLSRELLSNSDISIPVRPLGYPLFLWAVFKTFGINHLFVVYAQQALGILNYFLYFSIFNMVSGRRVLSAIAAFIVSISGVVLIYELAVMSDSLNLFLIVLSVFFFLKFYYKGGSWFLFPAALASAAAFAVRPTSLIFPACMALFLVIMLFRALLKNENARAYLKGLAILFAAFIIANGAFDMSTRAFFGIRGKTVGVGGLTLFVKSSDFIDYSSQKNAEVKQRFREMHEFFSGKVGPKSSDILSVYSLIPDIRCMPSAHLEEYRRASASSDRFFGPHEIGSDWFTIYTIMGRTSCDFEQLDEIFHSLAEESLLAHPAGYARSFFNVLSTSITESPDYSGFLGKALNSGNQSLIYLALPYMLSKFIFESVWFNAVAIPAFFLLGSLCVRNVKNNPDVLLFFAGLLFLNYMAVALILDHAESRYTLPIQWIEVFLFFYFFSEFFAMRTARILGQDPALTRQTVGQ